MSLRILYHHRTQGRGAEGLHIRSIVEALREMGHEVTVLSPPGVDPLSTDSDIPVDKTLVRTRGLQSVWKWISRNLVGVLFEVAELAYNLPAWWRVRRALRSGNFDLVYERYAFFMVGSAIAARRHRVPFVLEANEVSGIPHRARAQRMVRLCRVAERAVLRRCSGVLAVSSYLRDRIVAQGMAPSRVVVVPNAFDTRRIAGVTRDFSLASQYELSDSLVLGFVGWFDDWDRLDLLIKVFGKLSRSHPHLRLLLVGDGPVTSGLKALASQMGLESKIIFTGAVPRNRVLDYAALLDVAVLPNSNEFGSPVVMFEFMGLGIPVVAPRLGPILDVHDAGSSAMLFDPLDESQMEAAILAVVDSPELRRNLADEARRRLQERHSWRQNAAKILQAAGIEPASAYTGVRGHSAAICTTESGPLSICLIAELPPPMGGMAIQAVRLSDALRAEGHEIKHVSTNSLAHSSPIRRIPLLRGVVNLAMFIASLLKRTRGSDIVHIFANSGLSFFLFAVPAVAVGRLKGCFVILHYHGGAAPQFLQRAGSLVVPWLQRAQALLVPSAFLARTFAAYGLQTTIVPNLVETIEGPHRPSAPQAPRILMARNLSRVYNIACGLRVFREVLNRIPEAELIVAGDGPDKASLQDLAQALDLGDRCRFVGSVDNVTLRRMMLDADILLNTSRADNQPVSIMEAFSAGAVVVSTDVGGIGDLVTHDENGLLAPDDDHVALAALVIRVLSDPTLARRLTDRAKTRAADFTWPKVYPVLANVYGCREAT